MHLSLTQELFIVECAQQKRINANNWQDSLFAPFIFIKFYEFPYTSLSFAKLEARQRNYLCVIARHNHQLIRLPLSWEIHMIKYFRAIRKDLMKKINLPSSGFDVNINELLKQIKFENIMEK